MGQPVRDRRSAPRYIWSPGDITQATLRPGCVVHVVDLSAGGALVQAARQLRPGARLHFHLVLRRQRFGLFARVLRCAVWALDTRTGVIYRGALQFEQQCELTEATLFGLPVPLEPDTESAAWGRDADSGILESDDTCVLDPYVNDSYSPILRSESAGIRFGARPMSPV